MKQKAFFIIFKGLSFKQIKNFFLEGDSPTLNMPLDSQPAIAGSKLATETLEKGVTYVQS